MLTFRLQCSWICGRDLRRGKVNLLLPHGMEFAAGICVGYVLMNKCSIFYWISDWKNYLFTIFWQHCCYQNSHHFYWISDWKNCFQKYFGNIAAIKIHIILKIRSGQRPQKRICARFASGETIHRRPKPMKVHADQGPDFEKYLICFVVDSSYTFVRREFMHTAR